MTGKKGVMEFNWIFVVIIGAFILFLAIFFIGRLTGTQRYAEETELVKSFDILLNPFASIGGIGKITLAKTIEMPQTVQINQTCDSKEGKITMRIRSESTIGNKWGEWSAPNNIYNKYIFSSAFMQSKRFDIMSKPFEIPYRIDDLIYILDKDYCFVNAPSNVKAELEWINLSKLQFANSQNECKTSSSKVCFGTACDITVTGQCSGYDCENEYDYGYVEKSGKSMDYATPALMYAAIFSDSKMYSCEVLRLTARLQSLADIYKQKSIILSSEGCDTSEIQNKLDDLKGATTMSSIYMISKEVNSANPLSCPIF